MDDATRRQTDHEAFGKQQGGGGGDATSKGTSGVAPMAVKDLRNGSSEGQFIGGVLGDESRLSRGRAYLAVDPRGAQPLRGLLPAQPGRAGRRHA